MDTTYVLPLTIIKPHVFCGNNHFQRTPKNPLNAYPFKLQCKPISQNLMHSPCHSSIAQSISRVKYRTIL